MRQASSRIPLPPLYTGFYAFRFFLPGLIVARTSRAFSISRNTRTRTIHGQLANSRTMHTLQVIGKYGAPGESRTPDLLVRSQTLYPAELRAHRHDLTQLGAIPQLCWVHRC